MTPTKTIPIDALDRRTLDCIRRLIAEKGYPPTRLELKDCLGVASTSTVQRRVMRLVAAGLIVVEAGSRALRIVDDGD